MTNRSFYYSQLSNQIQAIPSDGKGFLGQYLPWMIAFLTVVLVVVLWSASFVGTGFSGMMQASGATLTIEIPNIQIVDEFSKEDAREAPEKVAERVMKEVNGFRGVKRVSVVDQEHLVTLLSQWISDPALLKSVHLPILLDCVVDEAVGLFDEKAFAERLKGISPHIQYHSHTKYQDLLQSAQLSLGVFTTVLVGFVLLSIIALMILVTRALVDTYQQPLNVLRLMGASHHYISGYFQKTIFWNVLRGGLFGLFLGILVLSGAFFIMRMSASTFLQALSSFSFPKEMIVFLLVLPVIMSGLSGLTARITVLQCLKKAER